MLTVTVSQLNRYIKAVLEEDHKLRDLYIKGEISNFKSHYASGHLYFSLKDADSSIRAVMFKGDAQYLRFLPENGMAVLVRAKVGVYERDGAYQLYINDIMPDGAGALAVAFEQRKQKLSALGMFDEQYKKPLPPLPERVGIVTSETGAALQDMLSVLARRYPLCGVLVSPALVQGSGAAKSVAAALELLDREGSCDVIIVGRGGGSTEDLWCFNEEEVAYGVFRCKTPVISAVGHETDYTICDFVADVRAPTPSAAAELAVPSAAVLKQRLAAAQSRMAAAARRKVARCGDDLKCFREHPVLREPVGHLRKAEERLDFIAKLMYNKQHIMTKEKMRELQAKAVLLDSLSPLKILKRGYCLAYRGKHAVQTVRGLETGDKVDLYFQDGKAEATVQATLQEDAQ